MFEIVVLLEQVWVYAGKKRVLEEEVGRTNLGGGRRVETYRKYKKWHNIFLFIVRVF